MSVHIEFTNERWFSYVLLLVAGWVLAPIPNDGIRKNVLSSDAHQGQVEIVSTYQLQKRNLSLLMNLSGETA